MIIVILSCPTDLNTGVIELEKELRN